MATNDTTTGKPADAIDILMGDHQAVKDLFKEFKRLESVGPPAARIAVVEDLCIQLIIHTALEEELFYPAVRQAISDDDLVNEAEIEHDTARYVIKQLLPVTADDSYLEAKVNVLREYTLHHINEEENEMFPKMRKTQLDLSGLGQRMLDRKLALQNQFAAPGQLAVFISLTV